jgi:hypothetical protein
VKLKIDRRGRYVSRSSQTDLKKKVCHQRYIFKNISKIRELLAGSSTGPVQCVTMALLVAGYEGHEGVGGMSSALFVVKAESSIWGLTLWMNWTVVF